MGAEEYALLELDEPAGLPDTTRREREAERRGDRRRSGVEWIGVVVGAFVIWFVVQTFAFQAFTIPSESMVPTLEKGDRVLVNKLSYRFRDVHRGDVVVFNGPVSPCGRFRFLVKRVVGLPGERVEGKDGRLVVNGTPLDEPYVAPGAKTLDFPEQIVPDDAYWMMGDNRELSCDSRRFGPIARKEFVGPVMFRFWPPGRLGGV